MAMVRKWLTSVDEYKCKSSYLLLFHNFNRCKSLCTWSPLVKKLLEQPPSKIKATLEAEFQNSSTFKTLEFSWDAIVTAVVSSSLAKANSVVEWRFEKLMKEHVKRLNCYSELISLCGKTRNVPTALCIFSSMEAEGLQPTSFVFNALLSACFSSGNLVTALSLFEVMERSENCKSDSDTYNAFISAYANMGNKKAMEAWHSAKKAAGFPADAQSYEYLIFGCINSRNYGDAERFYREMLLAGEMPNVVILQNMLVMYCEQRNFDKVKEFLKFATSDASKICRRVAEKIVGLYYELGRVEEMEELLETLTRFNQEAEILSLVHSAIIRMLTRTDRLDDVEYAVGRMLKQKISFRCPDDVEKVICSYFRRAAYDRLDLFLECIKDSYKLTRSTYDLLIAGYRRAGLLEKLDLVMDAMKLNGLF